MLSDSLKAPHYLSAVALIPIDAGHLNSVGMVKKGKFDIAAVKQFDRQGVNIPFVSPQALRKYIRNYLELKFDTANYYDRIKRKTTKKDFVIVDPIQFFEDDFLGYSHPLYENPNSDSYERRLKTAAMNRRSPFLTNGLIGIESLSQIHSSEGWVHPSIGTPLPYKAEFSTGYFQSSFALELDRIGKFENYGDIIELDSTLQNIHKDDFEDIQTSNGKVTLTLKDANNRKQTAFQFFFECILNLYGGAKATMFAESLHPSVLISVGSHSAVPLPTTLFMKNSRGELSIDLESLVKFGKLWKESLATSIYIGYRSGTFSKFEETRLKEIADAHNIILTTPGKISELMMEETAK